MSKRNSQGQIQTSPKTLGLGSDLSNSNEPGEDEQLGKQKMKLLKPIMPSGSEQSIDREMGKRERVKRSRSLQPGCRKGRTFINRKQHIFSFLSLSQGTVAMGTDTLRARAREGDAAESSGTTCSRLIGHSAPAALPSGVFFLSKK